jgi:2-oxoisovalerate dehydrogenase E1 component alpha subunit
MQNIGEEAIQIGSAAAMASDDVIFAQYREAGTLHVFQRHKSSDSILH